MNEIVILEDTRSDYHNSPGTPNKCLYCTGKIHEPHDEKCVVPQKFVTVDVTVRMKIKVPKNWDAEQIEFHRNQGSWCASNWVEELVSLDAQFKCLCDSTIFKVVNDGDS